MALERKARWEVGDSYDESCCNPDCLERLSALTTDLVLMTSPICGHRLCQRCIYRLFQKGNEIMCPGCKIGNVVREGTYRGGPGTKMRRSELEAKTKDQIDYDKEISVRRDLSKVFNKTEEGFPSLEEYYQYTEMVERYVRKLVENVDVEETRAAIDDYRIAHGREINIAQTKNARKETEEVARVEEARVEAEAMAAAHRRSVAKKKAQNRKRKAKELRSVLGDEDSDDDVKVVEEAGPAEIRAALAPMAFPPEVVKKYRRPPERLLEATERVHRRRAGGWSSKAAQAREKMEGLYTLATPTPWSSLALVAPGPK